MSTIDVELVFTLKMTTKISRFVRVAFAPLAKDDGGCVCARATLAAPPHAASQHVAARRRNGRAAAQVRGRSLDVRLLVARRAADSVRRLDHKRFLDPNEIQLSAKPLGEGGYGVVYRGRYRASRVAVKMPRQQEHMTPDEIKAFEDEVSLCRQSAPLCRARDRVDR